MWLVGASHSPATCPAAGTGGTRVLLARSHSEGLWEACGLSTPMPDLVSDGWGLEPATLAWEKLGAAGWTEGVGGCGGGSSRDAPLGGARHTAWSDKAPWMASRGRPHPTQPSLRVGPDMPSWPGTSPGGWGRPGETPVPPFSALQGPDIWSDIAGCFWEDVSEKINISFGFS